MSYEGGGRVPFVIYWKGKIDAGIKSNAPISNLDILPTLLTWTGAKISEDITLDGQDISDLFMGKVNDHDFEHRPIFLVNHGEPEAVKVGKWKYREAPEWYRQSNNERVRAITELFNLDADPYERVNLLEEYPEKVKELKKIFDQYPPYQNP